MAARPRARQEDNGDVLTAYELEREARIRRNKEKMDSLGIMEQKTLFEAAFRVVKKVAKPKAKKVVFPKVRSEPLRSSSRLTGSQPEYAGLSDDLFESGDGRLELPNTKNAAAASDAWAETVKERRCDSTSRGSLYDSHAGICCHFCRQKKLCGEADCKRCADRNTELPCLGKSECTRCGSATGRFCRACLNIRYGMQLEQVRLEMEAGTWLCPHCYEEDHPHEGWMCNSSICMTKRGLKPTGIAIYDAQQQGFLSVAHHLQAKLLHHRASRASTQEKPQARKGKAAAAKPAKKARAPSNAQATVSADVLAAPRRTRSSQRA